MIRKVAKDPSSRFSAASTGVWDGGKIPAVPMCWYSWANITASILCSEPVRNRVQNDRMEEGEARSHCSAYICSFENVARNSEIRIVTFGESMGCGESAIICAPR